MAIAVETTRAINSDGIEFLDDLGRRIIQLIQVTEIKSLRYKTGSISLSNQKQ